MEEIKKRALQLFQNNEVDFIIGFENYKTKPRPLIIFDSNDTEKLILNGHCDLNLAKYLLKPELKNYKKKGIVARIGEIKALIQLAVENQIKPEEIVLLGVLEENDTYKLIPEHKLLDFPQILKNLNLDEYNHLNQKISSLNEMSSEKRLEFFKEEFDKCIKCYACRSVCPMCYCPKCITEGSQIDFIPKSSHEKGNFYWNFVRAYHLSGRCVLCGACEKACPVSIKLMLVNKEQNNFVKEKFNYEAGTDLNVKPLLSVYSKEDKGDFFK